MEQRDQNGYLERGGAVRAAPELRGGGWSEQCRTMEARHAALSAWHLSSCTKHTLQMLCQIEADGTHSEESTRNDQILLAHLPSMYCTCLRCTALAFDALLQYIEGCGFHLTCQGGRNVGYKARVPYTHMIRFFFSAERRALNRRVRHDYPAKLTKTEFHTFMSTPEVASAHGF